MTLGYKHTSQSGVHRFPMVFHLKMLVIRCKSTIFRHVQLTPCFGAVFPHLGIFHDLILGETYAIASAQVRVHETQKHKAGKAV